MGNVRSVYNALKYVGADPIIVKDPSEVKGNKIVIPGVGAFREGMKNLNPFIPKIREAATSHTPVLGICLGLQMFFEESEEAPKVEGLGLLKGKIRKIRTSQNLPQIGWNFLEIRNKTCPLFKEIKNGYVYFVHSYHPFPEENIVVATTEYGTEINASVWKNHLFGMQFHPEKSGEMGLQILKNFVEL
jgi:glutamine amidotransferase